METRRPQRAGARRTPGIAGEIGRAMGAAVLETLWPTRCAVCDAPGTLLCDECRRALPYIDRWRACPRCGAPFGIVQCTECNPVSLARLGMERLPFDACASAVSLDDAAHRVATLYKDAGERRLGHVMGRLMADAVDPDWLRNADAVTWVPASRAAFRRRGFDHAEDLARAFADASAESGLLRPAPARALLERPDARDQRGLSRADRISNMAGRFRIAPETRVPPSVVVVDDVFTTGATIFAAAAALREAGARTVRCVTFARTMRDG